MLELLSEDYGDVSSPYAYSRDVYELFYDYFGDLFDRDDPIDIFEWLVTGVSRDEWGIEDEFPRADEDELSVIDSTSSKWQQFSKLVQTESRFIFLAAGSTRVPAGGVTAAEFVATSPAS